MALVRLRMFKPPVILGGAPFADHFCYLFSCLSCLHDSAVLPVPFSVVGIAPVLLTRRFSSSQMFSIMFKSCDLGEKTTTFSVFAFRYVVLALARWAGALDVQ